MAILNEGGKMAERCVALVTTKKKMKEKRPACK
jgi:hypothetical protein